MDFAVCEADMVVREGPRRWTKIDRTVDGVEAAVVAGAVQGVFLRAEVNGAEEVSATLGIGSVFAGSEAEKDGGIVLRGITHKFAFAGSEFRDVGDGNEFGGLGAGDFH